MKLMLNCLKFTKRSKRKLQADTKYFKNQLDYVNLSKSFVNFTNGVELFMLHIVAFFSNRYTILY